MNKNRCVACNSGNFNKQGEVEGYVQGGKFDIFLCADCGTSWSNPHISGDGVYELIYKHRDDAPGYMRYGIYAREVLIKSNPEKYLSNKEEMYYGLFKSLREYSSPEASVLDVGCGLGYVTYALNKAGYNAQGLDISEEAISQAKERYGNSFICEDFFNLDHNDKTYDAICMLELIEHVAEPSRYINHAMNLLKKGGVLIVTTPNKSFYPKGSLWETDAPPVHITWFSEGGILKIFKGLGFEVVLMSFRSYNLFNGDVYSRTILNKSQRTPIFSKEGKPLYSRYKKSNLRIKAERFHMYGILKTLSNFTNKIVQIMKLAVYPSAYTGIKSNITCAVILKDV